MCLFQHCRTYSAGSVFFNHGSWTSGALLSSIVGFCFGLFSSLLAERCDCVPVLLFRFPALFSVLGGNFYTGVIPDLAVAASTTWVFLRVCLIVSMREANLSEPTVLSTFDCWQCRI